MEIEHFLRIQLGMSKKALAKRASVPQSTISRIEQEERDANLSALNKILGAISCDLLIVPLLEDSIMLKTNKCRF